MAIVRGCNLPEELHYHLDKHVWARMMDGETLRVGMTTVAGKLSGGKLAAITVKAKSIGQEVKQGKSVATVESSKYVGPVPAPVTGILLRSNEKVTSNPGLALSDPYGEGWIVEMKPTQWESEKGLLVTGAEGIEKYRAKLEADNITCE